MNPHQRRSSNWVLTGGAAVCMVVAAQTGCMPDFNAITSKWHPASGAGGKGRGGTSSGSGGQPGQAGTTNGGTSSAGKADGGKANGGKANGNAGRMGMGGTGIGATGPGGEAGTENGGNGGAEGGATGVGGTSVGVGGTSVGGSGGTSTNGGEGGATCDPGFTTCPGSGDCATQLAEGEPSGSTFQNCGACGTTCSTANSTSVACTSGQCRATCATNFGDCNGPTANDGCEADLTSAATCNSCSHRCASFGTTARACTTGLCAPTCAADYLDCTADDGTHADDGCETYIDTLTACGATCSTAGVACDPDQVCNAGACVAASGLVAMSFPFTASGQGQRFADLFPAAPDLSYATVTARFYAPGAVNGTLSTYLVDTKSPQPDFTTFVITDFATLSAGWIDIAIPLPAPGGTFDTAHIHQITFDFDSTGTPASNPTVVYLDSVRSSDGVINDTFDSTSGSIVGSSLKKFDGSTATWVSALP